MIIVEQDNLTAGWLDAAEKLLSGGGDAFTGVVLVREPGEAAGKQGDVRVMLDDWLDSHGYYDTQTVANTIFPEYLAAFGTEEEVYARYRERLWPQLRRVRANARGTYFLRLIGGRSEDAGAAGLTNPLAIVLEKIRVQLATGRPIRCAYELPIYSPLDRNVIMGFPCLSHVSLKIDGDRLHVTGLYRNQCYVQRLYGNLLGLSRLQAFAARHTTLTPGSLVCHASHAEAETNGGLRSFRTLLANARAALNA